MNEVAALVPDSDVRVALMAALDLAMDYAYHDGTERELAVAATALELAGYWDFGFGVTHASRDDVLTAVSKARKGRPKRLLLADARGMIQAFDLLARSGVITYASSADGRNRLWLARGGYDGNRAGFPSEGRRHG